MKTIGFYSYKGGTGKSLLSANLAVCLSRLGYNCVVVDCDVLGPSVHHKFGQGAVYAPGRGGLLELIASCFDSNAWHARRLDDVRPKEVRDIQSYVYSINSPRDETEEKPEKKFGHIHILPAGDTSKSEYWEIVWSPLWRELFTVFNAFATRRIEKESYVVFLDFLLQIKAGLEKLVPAPDYMIVDFASGASEMSTTLINAWVDTIVYALAFNDESVGYLKKTYGRIRKAGIERKLMGLSDKETDIHVVLSRVPTSFDYRDRDLDVALQDNHYPYEKIRVIHSDRDLEMLEKIRCGYQTLPQNRRLTHDYLHLFEELICPEHRPPNGVAERMGLPAHFEEKDRIFQLEAQRGTLINPNDNSRNVSLKVATFQNLLVGFENGLKDLMKRDPLDGVRVPGKKKGDRTKDWLKQMLASAGRKCGEAFGEALLAKIGRDKVGVHSRIEMWTHFDSDVGFGRFVFDDEGYEEIGRKGSRHIKCDIYLLESFLTPASDTSLPLPAEHRFCELMRGYIEGVLSRLLEVEIDVQHKHCVTEGFPKRLRDELGDLCQKARSESCYFRVQTCDHNNPIEEARRDSIRPGLKNTIPERREI